MSDDDSRTGARYTTPELLDYVTRTHAAHDPALARAFDVPEGIPRIQVSPTEGKFLGMLLRFVGAKKVVELGTLIGYSAIHMARALPAGGQLWTIEYEQRHADVARANIAAAGLADRVTIVVGSAREQLPKLEPHGPFDAVFIDADKESYDVYGRWALQHLRPGGLVIGDNAYVFGELMNDSERGRAMRAFHELVAAGCDSVCVPTPDGLVVGIKR
jgi:predicted O-methyltransferase YrrM